MQKVWHHLPWRNRLEARENGPIAIPIPLLAFSCEYCTLGVSSCLLVHVQKSSATYHGALTE